METNVKPQTVPQTRIRSLTLRRSLAIIALMIAILAVSAGITQLMLVQHSPRVVAFDMKKTLDSFMESVSQKALSEAQSKALSDRFNTALEQSLTAYQQQHHVMILVSPAVVQGAPDVTLKIQTDIARRMKGEPN